MHIKFINNQSLEEYSNAVRIALNYNDETLQYLKISLEVYIKNLPLKQRVSFIKALPDFIEVDQEILKQRKGTIRIKSLRQLAELSIEHSDVITSKKKLNSDKLLITIIVLFTVLQNFMQLNDAIPILKTEIDSNPHQRMLLNFSR